MILIDIILIASIITIIIDISGFNDTYKQILAKILHINDYTKIKGLCTFCITWWLSLLYIIIIGSFSIFNIFYILFIASLTPQIKEIILLVGDIITTIINYIYKYI